MKRVTCSIHKRCLTLIPSQEKNDYWTETYQKRAVLLVSSKKRGRQRFSTPKNRHTSRIKRRTENMSGSVAASSGAVGTAALNRLAPIGALTRLSSKNSEYAGHVDVNGWQKGRAFALEERRSGMLTSARATRERLATTLASSTSTSSAKRRVAGAAALTPTAMIGGGKGVTQQHPPLPPPLPSSPPLVGAASTLSCGAKRRTGR